MNNIINSIKATLYDRISSPLYGTFVFVWLLSNWEVVYITLFADETFLKSSTRLDYIVDYFAKGTDVFGLVVNSFFTYAFLLPLISTAVIILWLPKLLIELDRITLKYKMQRRTVKQEIEKERLLSVKESIEIINKSAELEGDFKKEIEKHSKEKIEFEKRIDAFVMNDEANKKINNDLQAINDDLQTKKDNLEADVIQYKDSMKKYTELKRENKIKEDFIIKMAIDGKIDFKPGSVIRDILTKDISSSFSYDKKEKRLADIPEVSNSIKAMNSSGFLELPKKE